MSKSALFVCLEPHQEHWQLGYLDRAPKRPLILGWTVENEDADGAVPPAVVQIIARSLITSFAQVTFACTTSQSIECTDQWNLIEGDYYRQITDDHWLGRIAIFGKSSQSGMLCSTNNSRSLIRAFDDGNFPWWLQGQVLFLSMENDHCPPPDLCWNDFVQVNNDLWIENYASIRGLVGIVRPGVDGVIAGIHIHDNERCAHLLASLETHSRAAGFDWQIIDEATFIERL